MATVLADPAACRIRSIINSQYASVGIRANPTQASARTPRQKDKTNLLPIESDKVPKSIGAIALSWVRYMDERRRFFMRT